jgi:phage terminase large subunit-like protein
MERNLWGNQPTHPHQLATGVDLAISESDSADYTAFVTGSVWGKHEHKMIYIVDAFEQNGFPNDSRVLLNSTIRKIQIFIIS